MSKNKADKNPSPEEQIELKMKEIDSLKSENKELTKQLSSAMDTISDQSAMLDKKPVLTSIPTVKHDGEVYDIVIPKFKMGENTFTTEDVQKDSSLVETLLEMGSGVLVKQ
jgi:hypothetical protein